MADAATLRTCIGTSVTASMPAGAADGQLGISMPNAWLCESSPRSAHSAADLSGGQNSADGSSQREDSIFDEWLSKRKGISSFLDRAKRQQIEEKKQKQDSDQYDRSSGTATADEPATDSDGASLAVKNVWAEDVAPQEQTSSFTSHVEEGTESNGTSIRGGAEDLNRNVSKGRMRNHMNRMTRAPSGGSLAHNRRGSIQHQRDLMRRPGTSTNLNRALKVSWEERLRKIVEHSAFTFFMLCMVLIHTVFFAFDTDYDLDQIPEPGSRSVSFAVDATFTLLYVIEAVLRAIAFRWKFFESGWNLLDMCVIVFSLADIILVLKTTSSDNALSIMPSIRMLRMLRIVRMVRLFRFFKQLWLLARGIMTSLKTVAWAWALIGIIIYIFALFFTRVFAPHTCDADADEELYEYFGSLPRSLFSVFQIITLEEWAMLASTGARHEMWVAPFFILLMMLSTWGVMQVIVAVFVNNALEASLVRSKDLAKRAQEEQEEACRRLCEVFCAADSDGNNVLSKAEFTNAMKDRGTVRQLISVGIDMDTAQALFDVLDIDGSETLDGAEFVEGVLRSRGMAQNKDLLGLRCDVWRVSLAVEDDLEMACSFVKARVQSTAQKVEALREEAAPILELAAIMLGGHRQLGQGGLSPGSQSLGTVHTRSLGADSQLDVSLADVECMEAKRVPSLPPPSYSPCSKGSPSKPPMPADGAAAANHLESQMQVFPNGVNMRSLEPQPMSQTGNHIDSCSVIEVDEDLQPTRMLGGGSAEIRHPSEDGEALHSADAQPD